MSAPRIPEAQARLDAMADAETLEYCLRGTYFRGIGTQAWAAKAEALGRSAITMVAYGLSQQARDESLLAARAGFCAVPALRGESK